MRHLGYRGTVATLLTQLQRVEKSKRNSSVGENDEIINTYLSVINPLSCCDDENDV